MSPANDSFRSETHSDELLTKHPTETLKALDRLLAEGSLRTFIEVFWPWVEPATVFKTGWALDAICLPYSAKIMTERGSRAIGEIVNSGWRGRVLSFNHSSGLPEWKKISALMVSKSQPLYDLTLNDGCQLSLTGNHPVYVIGSGYVRADKIKVGDAILRMRSLQENLYDQTEPQHVLQPHLLSKPQKRHCAGGEHAPVQILREAVLPLSVTANRRLLQHEMLRRRQAHTRKHNLWRMWSRKGVGGKGMPSLLRKIMLAWGNSQMPKLRRGDVSQPRAISAGVSGLRSVLRSFLFREILARQEQFVFCGWRPREEISAGLLERAAAHIETRKSSLFSLFAQGVARCASRQWVDGKQQGLEPRSFVQEMSLPAAPAQERLAHDEYSVSESVVSTVEQKIWPQEALYNLEVEDNNNYFAESVLVHNCEHLEAVSKGQITRLLMNVPPGFMKSLTTNCFWPAWEWGPLNRPATRYVTASYSQSLTIRDNKRFMQVIRSDLYRQFWGSRFVLTSDSVENTQNDKTGWKLATSVGGVGTGERGNRVVIDDANSVKEAESDPVRTSTNQWFTEVIPTRLSDPINSSIIVIQQRTHEEDVSGIILAKELDYVHLMIPMEFDTTRICSTVIGWTDPRGLDENGDMLEGAALDDADGELAWPERFPPHVVKRDKDTMGPYACTPAESPVLMSDMTLRPISEVKVGETVVGFTTDTKSSVAKYKRRKLVPALVKSIHTYFAPVMKVTLTSGEVLRCTADHKWLSDRAGDGHGPGTGKRPYYRPAKVGQNLVRVCPSRLPTIADGDLADAGWLSGFFDGEGSASLTGGAARGRSEATSIAFYQGAGRNLPLCQKLEMLLTKFGFRFSMREFIRSDRIKSSSDRKNRQYLIAGKNLETTQRFLHIVQPTKWRQRIIDSAYRAKFISGFECVVSIEPDGEEPVYALETETGNYVVWGLASSNSAGQFQQTPEPRGGGIFKRDWWKSWPPADWPNADVARRKFPPMEYIVGSLDTAMTEKEENDYSALTIWGVWRMTGQARALQQVSMDTAGNLRIDDDRQPKMMLMYGWQKRLEMHGPPESDSDRIAERFCPRCQALPGTLHYPTCPFYIEEKQASWGLVEWTVDTCRRYRVDHLLIENKQGGITASQELVRLYAKENWGVELVDPRGSKTARAYSVQHLFSNGQVWAPADADGSRRKWCEEIITQMQHFPKTKHKDLTDSAVHALRHLRDIGLALRTEEADDEFEKTLTYHKPGGPLYPC